MSPVTELLRILSYNHFVLLKPEYKEILFKYNNDIMNSNLYGIFFPIVDYFTFFHIIHNTNDLALYIEDSATTNSIITFNSIKAIMVHPEHHICTGHIMMIEGKDCFTVANNILLHKYDYESIEAFNKDNHTCYKMYDY